MGNGLYGGKENGRFSKERTQGKASERKLEEQLDLSSLDDILDQELSEVQEDSVGTTEEFSVDLPDELTEEVSEPLPEKVSEEEEPPKKTSEEDELLETISIEEPKKPERVVQPAPSQKKAAQNGNPRKKPTSKRVEPQNVQPLDEEFFDERPQIPEVKPGKKSKKRKQKKPALFTVSVILAVLLFIESAYCVVIFTDWIKPLAGLRTIYINTAMSTMTHQWLAKALIPGDIVQKVMDQADALKEAQVGVNSQWGDVEKKPENNGSPSSGFSKDAAASMLGAFAKDAGFSNEEAEFFEQFYELDERSTKAYAKSHPEVIANGWSKFYVHEAGLDDEGTDIYTKQGDQVLAVDAENGLMVVRVTGSTYQGVLVIGKDASRLKCAPSSQWGAVGEYVGDIAENNNGLVAMTGSGFGDSPNVAEGSDQAGGAMCSGEVYPGVYGAHYVNGKRIELRTDNRFYIVDSYTDYSEDCTDATEFTPALIVDGVNVAGEDYTYTAMNPRACIGQTKDESILMLGIEGRKIDSIGCNAVECANILERYGAYQAMNLDGGTSAGIWYEGEYIMRCSNGNLIPEGRRLPNAWVYADAPVPNP